MELCKGLVYFAIHLSRVLTYNTPPVNKYYMVQAGRYIVYSVFFYHLCNMKVAVNNYLQGLKGQAHFGSVKIAGAGGLCFDLHTESIDNSRSWDVVVERNL